MSGYQIVHKKFLCKRFFSYAGFLFFPRKDDDLPSWVIYNNNSTCIKTISHINIQFIKRWNDINDANEVLYLLIYPNNYPFHERLPDVPFTGDPSEYPLYQISYDNMINSTQNVEIPSKLILAHQIFIPYIEDSGIANIYYNRRIELKPGYSLGLLITGLDYYGDLTKLEDNSWNVDPSPGNSTFQGIVKLLVKN